MNDGKRLVDAVISLPSESLAPIAALLQLNVAELTRAAASGVMNHDPDGHVEQLLSERVSAFEREEPARLAVLLLGKLAANLECRLPSLESAADLDVLATALLEATTRAARDFDKDFR